MIMGFLERCLFFLDKERGSSTLGWEGRASTPGMVEIERLAGGGQGEEEGLAI